MASFLVTAIAAAGFAISPPAEQTADFVDNPDIGVVNVRGACDRAVEQALIMTGGELLSVQPARNGRPICRITVLVVKANGRPKRIKLRIPMDF